MNGTTIVVTYLAETVGFFAPFFRPVVFFEVVLDVSGVEGTSGAPVCPSELPPEPEAEVEGSVEDPGVAEFVVVSTVRGKDSVRATGATRRDGVF